MKKKQTKLDSEFKDTYNRLVRVFREENIDNLVKYGFNRTLSQTYYKKYKGNVNKVIMGLMVELSERKMSDEKKKKVKKKKKKKKVKKKVKRYKKKKIEKPSIFGRTEHCYIEDIAERINCKFDTGAECSSMSASQIEVFQKRKGGVKYVSFKISHPTLLRTYHFVKKLKRISKIKIKLLQINDYEKRNKAIEKRPVVNLRCKIGKISKLIEVNLTDRRNMNKPLIIGVNGINKFNIAVLPQKRFSYLLKMREDLVK